ncbi:hypothetical protein [Paraflavitalea speifideaquila]|uniref:hypothetical protein n=1 Tax=Paraflavitalea speifideaquila TaxID=3076558 RepID=UPI0028E8347D|nr:hypothetical protein [Paraflavitalea speifideiaquila]
MRRAFLLLISFFIGFLLNAQTPLEDSLKLSLTKAANDAERINVLSNLSVYSMGWDNSQAVKYANEMMEIAEVSRNRTLMIRAFLYNARRYYESSGSQEAVGKAIVSATKAVELAKGSGLDDYTALAYTYLARGYRVSGELDKALNLNNLASALVVNSKDDSIRTIVFSALGSTYLLKNEKLLAFRNFLTAQDIAEEDKRYELLRNVYTNLGIFYNVIG